MPVEIGHRLWSIVRRQKALKMFGRLSDVADDLAHRSLSASELLSAGIAFTSRCTFQNLPVNCIDGAVCVRRARLLRRCENGNENDYRRENDCAHGPLQARVFVRDELGVRRCKIGACTDRAPELMSSGLLCFKLDVELSTLSRGGIDACRCDVRSMHRSMR